MLRFVVLVVAMFKLAVVVLCRLLLLLRVRLCLLPPVPMCLLQLWLPPWLGLRRWRVLLVRFLLAGVAVAVVDAGAVALLPAVSVLSVIGVREVAMFGLVAVVLCRRLLLLRVQLDLLLLCVQLDLLPPVLPVYLLRLMVRLNLLSPVLLAYLLHLWPLAYLLHLWPLLRLVLRLSCLLRP